MLRCSVLVKLTVQVIFLRYDCSHPTTFTPYQHSQPGEELLNQQELPKTQRRMQLCFNLESA